ncbi:MAG TPA: SDR family NAD(P)-dependent oxidoreductase [Vicinamibacterales bacterium]|nr:SDR family NAD(P)-dependent oxidoreductase [Vicinamibacterales bacterium]
MPRVVVTGGSRGLGLAIVRRLVCAGYGVVAVARGLNDQLAATMEEAGRSRPGTIAFERFDLADVDAIPAFVQELRKSGGPIHGLVNNAALGSDGALALMKNADIERLIRVNTLSPIVLTKYIVRHMLADGGGRVVNVSSIVASNGYAGLSVYSATKSALVGFTKSLAREVGRRGVTVNAVAPGFLDTDMTRGLDDERREQVARRSALKRLPAVDDVADAVEFLLGSKAKSITGTVLTVDAGGTA